MKFNFSIFFFFFISSFIFSQKVTVAISPDYELPRDKVLIGRLHSDNTGHWMLFDKRGVFKAMGQVTIEKYDTNLKLKYGKEYTTNDDNIKSVGVKYFKGKFAWLQYEKDRKNDELTFYISAIGLDGKGEKPKVISKFQYENRNDFPKITWLASQDTSKLVFIAEADRDSKREDYEAYISVLDNDFNELWSKKVKLPYNQKTVDTDSWIITDEGEVYFLAKVYEEQKGIVFGNVKVYDTEVYKITENKENNKKYKLNLGKSFIKGMKVAQSEFDKDIAVVGFIGDSRLGPIQGAGYLKLDKASESISYSKKRNFSEKELESFGRKNTSKDRKSKEVGLDDEFIIREIIHKKDGSFDVVAEEYTIQIVTSNMNNSTTTTTNFNNNHIIVLSFDPEGQVLHSRIIPKKYSASKGGYPESDPRLEKVTDYMFYSLFKTDNQLYFLYNDNRRNFEQDISDPDRYKSIKLSSGLFSVSFSDIVTVIAHIDKNGKLIRKELFDKDEFESIMMPKYSKQINENELFFFNRKSKFLSKDNFRFGVMTIEE